jgi:uncharacterized protein
VYTRFLWDPAKAEANVQKHGVEFAVATLVFRDPLAIMEVDRIESGEERWKTLGMARGVLLLLVAHTIVDLSDGSEQIRIISARKAEKHEWRRYEREAR